MNYQGTAKNANTPSTGVQSFMNKRFFGKKSLRPKGKALKKAKVEKAKATAMED